MQHLIILDVHYLLWYACLTAGKQTDGGNLPPVSTNGQTFPWNSMRLPNTILPLHYDLLIHPNLTRLAFKGAVSIKLSVQQDTKVIVMHSKDLQISKTALLNPDGSVNGSLQLLEYPEYQLIALLTEHTVLKSGNVYSLYMEFAANLSESFHGFYKSMYRTSKGEVRNLACTQFEPTSARAAFPCFDEPAFKSNFSIRIRREGQHIALSNMPKLRTLNLSDGLFEDQFDVSVKMSTYLVAFIVSDFLSISKSSQHGVKISVYTVPEKIGQAEYALDAAAKLLDFYEDFFDIPYPLPKLDLVAIPDFQAGAMENWGLTTYRETALLFSYDMSSASDKLGITMIIAHELAHQWFGNLVTMKWWDDLWLKEGFAKFMEFVSVQMTNPELQVEDYFLGKCFMAMEVDCLGSSHPVSTPVENPSQIEEMFDDVSYDKGACILHMLRDFLTPEAFTFGIVRYLKHYSYQHTVNSDLWESLNNLCPSDGLDESRFKDYGSCSQAQSKSGASKWHAKDELDVKAVMDTWTLQEGFPLVTVEVRGREVRLSQKRYLKGANPSQNSEFLWQVPLSYITSKSKTVHRFLLKTTTDVLYLPEEVEWIKFNVDMSGYYIVHYEGSGWDNLIKLLQHSHTLLSSNDRASLINNIFQLVSVGKVPLDKALDLSLYLSRETEIMPVTQGFSELVPLYKLMEKRDMQELENQMKEFIVQLFRELIDHQLWSDEGSVSQRMMRSSLLLFACVRGHPPCVSAARDLFQNWKDSDGNVSLPSDVSLAVFAVGGRTAEGWDFLWEKYKQTLFTSQKSRIKSALSISPLTHKLKWLLEQGLEGGILKTQDLPHIVLLVSKNAKGYKYAWDFLRANWPMLIKKFDLGSFSLCKMVVGVTSLYSTSEMLEEVSGFFGSLSVETGSEMRCIQQAYENIEENIRWMNKNQHLLQTWLNRHVPQVKKPK
ncbi:endoplasmic reticulum aminopeptidase 1-like isoform X2 [Denticeps clupeoides]|uniref:endoplasmic reticulum aminopeptidase 1-like isoform X2 n=1 Tax=Denticeps clupeoides TaxID=299321 RepID=UPI0010A3B704|nr:endoplasmic reticulum aminopeptidase 1-like isoform X2 [Denticeps clupeoides]